MGPSRGYSFGMTMEHPLDIAARWQVQRFDRRTPREIQDAIVEPFWGGARVLAAIDRHGAALFHDGRRIVTPAPIDEALRKALLAGEAILEGHLSDQAFSTGIGARLDDATEPVRPLRMITNALVPGAGRREAYIAQKEIEAKEREREMEAAAAVEAAERAERLAFVATDLLWLDGEPLLDVPLLERKRVLEGVIGEAELVRRTAFVQPTATPSLVAWRSLGFLTLAWKAANSRYLPGEVNQGWTIAPAPSTVVPGRT
jgi:ATP-dependent DNA ligase